MAKLQKITRTNGSSVFSVNIPLELIEQLKWAKGDVLLINVLDMGLAGDPPRIMIERSKNED